MSYLELLTLAAPETILVGAALVVLTADLAAKRGLELRFRFRINVMLSAFGCLAALAWLIALPQQANFAQGMLVVDPLTRLVNIGLLVLTLFTLLLSAEADFTSHAGEYCALVLLATIGMMFLVSAQDILLIFLALELTSLSLYILTGFNKRRLQSAEAALKYFLFGGVAAAITLFGFSLLYGLSGSTNLDQIAAAIHGPRLDPLLVLALIMVLAGFGFKVAAAPFHLWAPDTYEGAPLPSAALIASGSKVAGFFILARVMTLGFKGAEGNGAWHNFAVGWVPLLAVIAAVSMLLGNLVALVQTSVRRLLAYSAIAHAGYMLLAVLSQGGHSLPALLYYVLTYALTTLGAFGVVSVVQAQTGGERLSDFAGLSRRAPVLSLCMLVFMLSLAGIPPLAGFFGKFYIFTSALYGSSPPLGLLWLVALALATSAVSLYYYLIVLKQIYVASAPDQVATLPSRSPLTHAALILLALAVLLLGCAPDWLIAAISSAIART